MRDAVIVDGVCIMVEAEYEGVQDTVEDIAMEEKGVLLHKTVPVVEGAMLVSAIRGDSVASPADGDIGKGLKDGSNEVDAVIAELSDVVVDDRDNTIELEG